MSRAESKTRLPRYTDGSFQRTLDLQDLHEFIGAIAELLANAVINKQLRVEELDDKNLQGSDGEE